MHGICFSFKVWKDFLLVRGRRELSKPRFGALRTFRTKRSDHSRKSVYFAQRFGNLNGNVGSTGTKSSGTGIPVEQIPGMAQAKVSPHPGAVALNRCRSGHRFRSGHRGRDGRSDGRSGSLEAYKRWVWSCARSSPRAMQRNR